MKLRKKNSKEQLQETHGDKKEYTDDLIKLRK
jgi:hypothetical protein